MNIGTKLEKGFLFIVRKVFSSMFFRVLGLLSGLGFSWLVANRFGTYSLGLLSINLAVAYILVVFLKLGVDTHIVSEVAKLRSAEKTDEISAYFRKTLVLYLITSVVGTLIIYLCSGVLGDLLNMEADKNYLRVTSFCLFPLMVTHLNAAFMRAYKKVMAFSFFLNGGASFVALLCIIPFLGDTELHYIPLYVQLAALGLLSLISTLMVFGFVKPLSKGKYPKTYRQILEESLPMMVTLAVHPLWNWGGIFILGIFVETRIVGIFQILLKCSNLIGLPIRAISTIMAPVVSEESSSGHKKGIRSAIIKTSSLSLILSLPIILGTIFFAPYIMQFFGNEFVPFALLLIGLSLAKFINACYGPMSIILLMSGHQKLQCKLSLMDLSFYLLTTLLFSYQWGLDGAVVAMFTSILFRNLLIGEWVRRIFGIYPLSILHINAFLKSNLKKRNG